MRAEQLVRSLDDLGRILPTAYRVAVELLDRSRDGLDEVLQGTDGLGLVVVLKCPIDTLGFCQNRLPLLVGHGLQAGQLEAFVLESLHDLII